MDADAPDDDSAAYQDSPLPEAQGYADHLDDESAAQVPLAAWPPLPAVIDQIPPVLGNPPQRQEDQARPLSHRCESSGDAWSRASPEASNSPEASKQTPASARDRGTPARRPPPGSLDLTISWPSLTGTSTAPAFLGRIGPITTQQALPLAAIAALDPHTQWRVILTDPAGLALAVERVRRQSGHQHQRPPGVVGRVTVTVPASAPGQEPPRTTASDHGVLTAVLRAAKRAAARSAELQAADVYAPGGCAHTAASASYRPPPRIREYVEARDQTCRHPRCRQPAWRSDLDHTVAWHRGGLTCTCNLGGECRTHHQIKQRPGWRLTQSKPGYFELTTPASRTYTTEPDSYPA